MRQDRTNIHRDLDCIRLQPPALSTHRPIFAFAKFSAFLKILNQVMRQLHNGVSAHREHRKARNLAMDYFLAQ